MPNGIVFSFFLLPVVVKDDEVVRPDLIVPVGKQRGESRHCHLLRIPESHSQSFGKTDRLTKDCIQEQEDAYRHCLHKSYAGLKTL